MIAKKEHGLEDATLSFFSRVVEKDEISYNHSQLKRNIVLAFRDLMHTLTVTSETNESTTNYYVEIKGTQVETVEKWRIVVTFLDQRKMGRNGTSYLQDYRILVTFHPEVKQQFLNNPAYAKKILEDSVNILAEIPNSFTLKIDKYSMEFELLTLSEDIDVGKWKVIVGQERVTSVHELLTDTFGVIKTIDSISRKMSTQRPIKAHFLDNVSDEIYNRLFEIFKYSGITFDSRRINRAAINFLTPGQGLDKNPVIFGSFQKDGSKDYFQWKLNMSAKGVPTQNIRDASSNAQIQTIKLETMHKLGIRPLELTPDEETGEVDGFLYLTRISDLFKPGSADAEKYKDLLGSVITYGKRSGETEEMILTISDPFNEDPDADDFVTGMDKNTIVNNAEIVTGSLVEGMSLRGLTLNILLTKRPLVKEIVYIVNTFKSAGIKINKVFYFSTKYSCSPSDPERLLEGGSSDMISYRILHYNHLFYQPSQLVFGQFDIGTAYCELMYPLDNSISRNDVISILRLAKRRLYRIYNVPSLRIPEPIVVFGRGKREIIAEAGRVAGALPLRLFI